MPSKRSTPSNVREIVVVGRRGPAQAAFTNPELRELGELADADVIVDADELERALAVEDPNMDVTATNNVTILRDYAGRAPTGKSKKVILRFLLSPVELVGDGSGVRTVVLARNQLQEGEGGRLKAVATGESERHRGGPGDAGDRLSGQALARRALRRALGHDPQRGRARHGP